MENGNVFGGQVTDPALSESEKPPKEVKKCSRCGGDKRIFIVTGVHQGQSYGPETEGYYKKCPNCA